RHKISTVLTGEMDSTLGKSNRNIPSSSRSLRSRAARLLSDRVIPSTMRTILPLSGLHELTSIAETLIDSLQDSSFEHVRCSTLALRIRHLLDIAVDMTELDPNGVQKLKRDLQETKIAFEEASSPRRVDFRKAKRNLQALEDLERKVNALVELIKMKLQLQLVFAQQDDGLKAVEAHEIRDQTILPPTPGQWEHQQWLVSAGREGVTTCRRSGRVGKLPVVYVTYSAVDAIDAEKGVREALNLYSQCLHPNVATVMGITKGQRLNGIVFASAAMPYEEFLSRVSSPTALIRCLRGSLSSAFYFLNIRMNGSERRPVLRPGVAQVEPNGHVIVTPTENIFELIRLYPLRVPSMKNLDPAVLLTLQLFEYNPDSKFPDLMAQCRDRLTELKVLELADAANVLPMRSRVKLWTGIQPPPFTLQAGDVGKYAKELQSNNLQWSTVDRSQIATGQFLMLSPLPSRCGGDEAGKVWASAKIEANTWRTLELHHGFEGTMSKSFLERWPEKPLDWKSLVAHWTRLVNGLPGGAGLESVCLCREAHMQVLVKQHGSLPDNNKVYFHRRLPFNSDPQDFWGFFSSNIDPTAREDDLNNKGWAFSYDLSVDVYRVVDGWRYKHKQLLKQRVKPIPGSFPGIEAEDSSNEEDA
ncbi:hypothetical protein FRC06_006664, partial [Ceratobasidium sp. 370]